MISVTFTAEQKTLFAQQMAEYTCQMEADCIGGTCLQDDGPRAPTLLVQNSAECIKPGDPTAPGKVIDSGEEGTTLIECNKDAPRVALITSYSRKVEIVSSLI